MSEDESFIGLVSGAVAIACWVLWYRSLLAARRLGPRGPERRLLALAPLACAGLLAAVLARFAASDVRDSAVYFTFYLVMGMAWVGASAMLLPLLGLSPRDDVAERRNPAAAWAIAGALVGLTLCFAGANIGEGPGWWVVVFSAALATVALLLSWRLLHFLWPAAERITVDRELATGKRMAALLVALGLVLGRAGAGDWHSAGDTVRDFVAVGWPAPVLLVGAGLGERFWPRFGVTAWLAPSALYLGAAAGAVALYGIP